MGVKAQDTRRVPPKNSLTTRRHSVATLMTTNVVRKLSRSLTLLQARTLLVNPPLMKVTLRTMPHSMRSLIL